MSTYDRLSAQDSSFLHLERLETPMHVGGLSVFEGAPFNDSDHRFRLADVRELVESRLHLVPRFRKRLMHVPGELGRPIWVDDDRFDISYHVRLTALPAPGNRQQLLTLTERVQAGMLDRSRPLWELWFVEGLEDGNVALIQKTHHALVDGVSAVDVATVLLDFTPEPTLLEAPPWTPAPAPSPEQLLVDSLIERVTEPAEIVRGIRRILRGPRHALERASQLARSVATFVDRKAIAPRTSLNRRVGRNRRFEPVRVSLDDVKAIRQRLGGTVNDVILAGVAGGLARLLESREELEPGLTLKVMCPVSVRDESEEMQLGNRVSAMFVPLAVGEPDPIARLDAVRASTVDLKEREQALGAAFLSDLSAYAAPTLLGLAARLAHRQPFFNLVVTNVPGPQTPLYCMGGRMLEAYPVVPLTQNLGVVVGILSYCGQLHLGLFADRDTFADLGVLAAGIEEAFAELGKLASDRELNTDKGGPVAQELWERDAWELADEVRAGEQSAAELLDVSLARIEKLDPTLNAVGHLDAAAARALAEEIDTHVGAGEDPGPLAGIPMGVKELAEVAGWPCTHASVPYKDAVSDVDCTEVARLREAGAVITAQTTSPEHGTVSFTSTPLHGITRNPWNPDRTPGGSSGGSAAAVASAMFPACTGSDGGGSIRIPCSYSGLFGMKTTFGMLGGGPGPPDYPSLTSVHGPMVRSVRDAARYVDVCAGPTLTDFMSLPKPPVPFEELVTTGEGVERLRGKRAAWTATLGHAVTDPEVEKKAHEAALALVDLAGLELVDIPVELPKPGMSWGILSSLGTAAWHLDNVRDHLDDLTEVHRAGMEMMDHLRGSGVFKAIRRRHELMTAIAEVWSQVDVLLTPTTATPAFEAEGRFVGEVAGREVNLMGLSAAFTAPFNMSGQPAASIPCGLVDGMPVAVQVVARRHEDELCFAAGALLEEARPWPKLAPLAYE